MFENSKWLPGGHLEFLFNVNFSYDQQDIKWIVCEVSKLRHEQNIVILVIYQLIVFISRKDRWRLLTYKFVESKYTLDKLKIYLMFVTYTGCDLT